MTPTIVVILWLIISILVILQNIELCLQLSYVSFFIVIFILLLTGPILALAAITETILDIIIPEGWDGGDNNDFKRH